MAFLDNFKGKQYKTEASNLKQELDDLKRIYDEIGGAAIVDISAKIRELEEKKANTQDEFANSYKQLNEINAEINEKKNQILVLDDDIAFESFALYTPRFKFSNSEEYKNRLLTIREKQKVMIRNKVAATGNQGWTVNGSNAQGKKMVNDMIKLVLRSFNNECDYCVDNVKFNNIDNHQKRIWQSFQTLNKLGEIMNVSISAGYYELKLQELYLSHEYQIKKQEEKEEQKQIREELREQAKLEQEIKQARDRLAKERKHFDKAINELKSKINNTTDENELGQLNEKLSELQDSLAELVKEEKLIDYQEKNAKAGYVYIISNIGAFGENVYKIGMTRRLEPTERVDELGDASVPFNFDIHAMIFSDDAPALENALHKAFEGKKLNMINQRREFFNVTLDEIESVIKANFDKTVEITKMPPAEQYRESLILRGKKQNV